ncbi:unnamed protein product [Heterobilharzia americana]|nr:unnamed protein product [Heterobilharzia americana]
MNWKKILKLDLSKSFNLIGGQHRLTSGVTPSIKSFTSSNSSKTTPTPVNGSITTSPDSTKYSSRVCSPRNESTSSDDGQHRQNDADDGNSSQDVQDSSKPTGGRNTYVKDSVIV